MKQTRVSLRTKIAVGYALIIVLIGGIVGTYLQEWRQLETLDTETRHIRLLADKEREALPSCPSLRAEGEAIQSTTQ